MAKISTKKLFDLYFASISQEIAKRTRGQVDKPEIYTFEQQKGKQIIDMKADELFEMLDFIYYKNKGKKRKAGFPYASYGSVASIFRKMWNYYIENYEVIINPWNTDAMRGAKAVQKFMGKNPALTKEVLDDLIRKTHGAFETERANYYECIMRLYYEGFQCGEEIINLKEEDINFRTNEITLPGRIIKLSERCMSLLQYVHNMDEMEVYRSNHLMLSYHGGYFKNVVMLKKASDFQDRTIYSVVTALNAKFGRDVAKNFGVDINYRSLFYLGFHDYMVKQIGEERTREIITLGRNSENTRELSRLAAEYGIKNENISLVKRSLMICI